MLERIRLNMLGVYTKVFGDPNEVIAAYEQLYEESRGNPNVERTDFVDKLLRSSKTPSLFKLDYMTTISRVKTY